jgi:hypothetical protein
VPYLPPRRTVNNHDDGKLFDRTEFVYAEATDTFHCKAGQTPWRRQFSKRIAPRCIHPEEKSAARAHSKPVARWARGVTFLGACMREPSAHAERQHAGSHEAASSDRGAGDAGLQPEPNLNILGGCQLRDALTA